jgi:hypothetical protein
MLLNLGGEPIEYPKSRAKTHEDFSSVFVAKNNILFRGTTTMSFIASLFSKRNDQRYSLTSDDDETLGSESRSFLSEKTQIRPKSFSAWHLVLPWIFSTVAFAFLSLYLYFMTPPSPLGTYETGWKTDFGNYTFSTQVSTTLK